MENWNRIGVTAMASSFLNNTSSLAEEAIESRSNSARNSFQWGGTLFALFLMILNRTGLKSAMQTTLLVFYLFTSFPTVLFQILRGQFGYSIAFLAVAANLFFPEIFPASRFILFVIMPDWLTGGLRDSIAGGIFGLLIGIVLVILQIRGIGGYRNCNCDFRCFCYCLAMPFLFYFTIMYVCFG